MKNNHETSKRQFNLIKITLLALLAYVVGSEIIKQIPAT